jgi:hypothetical protein
VPSLHVAIGPEPVSASLEPIYRLNARGPPLISC